MARIATKKTVKKGVPFSFSIKDKEIIERENFGAFEVIKTKKGIMYKNYTGYHIWFSPYTVGPDGKAHETSTYAWLNNLLTTKKIVAGHEEEMFDGVPATKGDILNADVILTEAALSFPMTAFIDLDRCTAFAKEHMDWLKKQMELLEQTENTPVEEETEEDIKKNLEHDTKVLAMEQIAEEIKEGGNA